MNSINITGTLTRDCEIKQVGDSNVINFSIANNDEKHKTESGSWDDIASFFSVSTWSKTGKIANHLKKGKTVSISGILKQEIWKNESGENRSRVVIRAKEVIPHVYEKANDQSFNDDQLDKSFPVPEDSENNNDPF